MSEALAIGDRIARWKKLFDLFKQIDPGLLDKLLNLIPIFGGPEAAKWIELIRKVLGIFKQPTTASVSEDDLNEQIASACSACGVTLAEADGKISQV